MQYRTGQTIFENVLSLDADNNPVSAATFDIVSLRNGLEFTGITLNMMISDGSRGIFTASWSADTTGDYQFYMKNNITNVIFITDPVSILTDGEFDQTIYIGL